MMYSDAFVSPSTVDISGPRLRLLESSQPIFTIRPENRFKLDARFLDLYRGKQPAWGFGALSQVVFARTYARPVDEEGRNEQFWETLRRVTEGTFSILRQRIRETGQRWDTAEAQAKGQEFFQRMWAFKFLPSGRQLWFMGSDALELKGGAPLSNCAFVSTESIANDFTRPFCTLMDLLMLGLGVGFDVRGAGKLVVQKPRVSTESHVIADSREGWVDALEVVLNAFIGSGAVPHFDYSAIRAAGEPLRTFGGISSGYRPLEDLLLSIQALLLKRVGQAITSGDITDTNNYIGRCVVSGNVRRSSELSLGLATDSEFMALKDPSRLNGLFEMQAEIAKNSKSWSMLEEDRGNLRSRQSGLSLVSSEFAAIQDKIDAVELLQRELLEVNPAWTALEQEINNHPLRTHRWASNNTVMCDRGHDYREIADRIGANGEPGVMWLENMRQYGRMADAPNYVDHRALGTNPCSEITLESEELCNVPETFPANHDSLDDYKQTLRMAYILAKTVSCVPTHNPAINATVNRNRRLGISMAGVAALYERLGMHRFTRWLDEGYKHLRKLDKDYSGWMGVPESIKVTSIKPGGSVPLLTGHEGGMKFPTSQNYFRTVRIADDSPLIEQLRRAGYRTEKDRYAPNTMIVYFPVKGKEGVRRAADVSVWEQAAIQKALQGYWSDNQVSATLTFQPSERLSIRQLLEAHEDHFKTVSFLPFSNHGYVQAPYIEATEAEVTTAEGRLKPLSLGGNIHEVDDKYCSGGICELPAR